MLAGFGWLAVTVVALTLLYFLIIAAAGIFVSARNLAPKAQGAVAALPGAIAAFFWGYAKIMALVARFCRSYKDRRGWSGT